MANGDSLSIFPSKLLCALTCCLAVFLGCPNLISANNSTEPATGLNTGAPRASHMNINATQAFELINKHKNSAGFIILDVREKHEYEADHLPGAILLPRSLPDFAERIGKLDKKAVYLVYCRSGSRSLAAVEEMKKQGFENIYMLKGGIIEWREKKLPVEKG